jgi:hypothetical protein
MSAPTFGDMLRAVRSCETTAGLRATWDGLTTHRPDLEDHQRIMLMERALGRLLAIEARHEGDGR